MTMFSKPPIDHRFENFKTQLENSNVKVFPNSTNDGIYATTKGITSEGKVLKLKVEIEIKPGGMKAFYSEEPGNKYVPFEPSEAVDNFINTKEIMFVSIENDDWDN